MNFVIFFAYKYVNIFINILNINFFKSKFAKVQILKKCDTTILFF